MRAAQHSLEEDIIYKENTLGIDAICHKLTNYSRGINYFTGIEKFDPTVSSIEAWTQASSARINKYDGFAKFAIYFVYFYSTGNFHNIFLIVLQFRLIRRFEARSQFVLNQHSCAARPRH